MIDSCVGRDAILLLPGFMGEAETSFLYVLALDAHFRVISLTYPPSIGRIETLCDGLASFMAELEIRQAMILGGSSSRFVTQAFVRRHPSRVSRFILTHTGLPNPGRAHTAKLYLMVLRLLPFGLLRWLMQVSVFGYFSGRASSPVFWCRHFSAIICRQSREALLKRLALMDDFHSNYRFRPADLGGWPGKILIMEMSREHLSTTTEQMAMRKLYSQARLHIFSESAHYAAVEHSDDQILVIKEFLLTPEASIHV
jgi:pimeloyl-ACP methyl ester carboxylesterase